MTRYLVNPLALFLAVWGTAVALYIGGVYAGTFPPPQSTLWVAVLLNIGGFTLGYLTWAAFQGRTASLESVVCSPQVPTDSRLRTADSEILSTEKIAAMLRFTGLMGIVALALAAYRTAVIASSLGTTVPELLTHPGMLRDGFAMFVTAGVFQTSWIVMLNSVTSSLFSIGFVLLGVFLHVEAGRRKYFYLVLFLLITLATGLTSVSRAEATVNIAYMVFAYCFVRSASAVRRGGFETRPYQAPADYRRKRPGFLAVLLPFAAVAVLFLLIDLLLGKSAEYGRPDRLRGFVYHLFWYLASPLAAFNEFLAGFDGRHHFGQYVFFPFYKWLYRFHLTPEADISVFGEFVLIPYAANVYTYLRNFYEDFGMMGVVTAPYLLGLAASVLRGVCSPESGVRSLESGGAYRLQTTGYQLLASGACYLPYLNLYLVLLMLILFSFYNFFLFSNQVYLQILFGFLFLRYRLPGSPESGGAYRLRTPDWREMATT